MGILSNTVKPKPSDVGITDIERIQSYLDYLFECTNCKYNRGIACTKECATCSNYKQLNSVLTTAKANGLQDMLVKYIDAIVVHKRVVKRKIKLAQDEALLQKLNDELMKDFGYDVNFEKTSTKGIECISELLDKWK